MEQLLNTIPSLIGSIGFPIVCCIMMWRQMLTQQEQHKTEMEQVRDALNNNTIALNALINKLEGEHFGKETDI